jgi:hypothetical protein
MGVGALTMTDDTRVTAIFLAFSVRYEKSA